MRYLHFTEIEAASYPVCFLVPTIQRDEIIKAYFEPFELSQEDCLIVDLHYDLNKKKTSVTEMKRYITEELLPVLQDLSVEYLVCADAEYFKVLIGSNKANTNLGYVMDCVFGEPGKLKVIYVPNYRAMFYDPDKTTTKISLGIQALVAHRAGFYQPPGTSILSFEAYPKSDEEIAEWLQRLLDMDVDLTADIEGFSLKHYTAGIGTISFSWCKGKGIAFPVDYEPLDASKAPYGRQTFNAHRREMLRIFFEELTHRGRKLIWHHIAYDVYVLIYQLYMKDLLDTKGLLKGMNILLSHWDCTKLITFLATNSCAGNQLGLKDQAQEYAGNYALGDIKDITNIPLDKLLTYNLIDASATWHVYEKHWPTLVADQQQEIYETIFKPATLDIIQMQLTGMPLNMNRVKEVKEILEADAQTSLHTIQSSSLVQEFTYRLNELWVQKENQRLKVKRKTMADANEVFNPSSPMQLQGLLYEQLGLPVIAYSETKQPSTKSAVLSDLKNHTDRQDILDLLDALINFSTVSILLENFIPKMEDAVLGPDGWHYLFGNFNLGGTLSGRLSASQPSLQNIPAGAEGEKTKKGQYGKLIKSCFQAPPGWVFVGLDFASLEDRISALTTKDPNKLRVYVDGYDGHSLRAYYYYTEQMPDIDPNSVESINSIQKKYKPLRDKSKNPTFTLTYQGTWNTLVTKYKFTPELAQQVEQRYHELYAVSDQWVAAKLDQASKDGYITAAFGLRVRTPLLAQVIRGTKKTPYEAEAEGRSAGNALGQSWCLLNSRAWSEFMGKVRSSEHRLAVRPCAQIHDAGYALLREDIAVLAYTNQHLVQAAQWQDHPDIWHNEVKLGGELSVFWPSWAKEIVIPNGAGESEILEIIEKEISDDASSKS